MHATTLAAHRFGFAEANLQPLRSDPCGWVLAQWHNPAQPDATGLADIAEVAGLTRRVLQAALGNAPAPQAANPSMAAPSMDPVADPTMAPAAEANQSRMPAPAAALGPDRLALRRANAAALQRRWQHVVDTPTPVYERWVFFWSNHFSISATRGSTLGLVDPFEREAIRPHLGGRFAQLLRAATTHPGMLLYLDNALSVGPGSRAGTRRSRGLNENHARELLELHTLGPQGGYQQADVAALASLLTGWTVPRTGDGRSAFVPVVHEPGAKQVLGRRYAEGPEALDQLCEALARQPACARWIATKLVRHFVADDPPAALVDDLAARFLATDGDLPAIAEALFKHPLSWRTDGPPKFKRPEELLLSAHRLLGQPVRPVERAFQAVSAMGQPVGRAPSPQGWPDRSEDWLGPDALWKRVQWAAGMGDAHASRVDARALAASAFGPDLSQRTQSQIERADSAGQALALLLASPEFQRR